MKSLENINRWAKKALAHPIFTEQNEETIANDYPEAWQEVLRRRVRLKLTTVVIVVIFVLLIALRLQEYLPSHLAFAEERKLRDLLLWPSGIVLALDYWTSLFRCPRCHGLFMSPGVRRVSSLERPRSRCKNCGLIIGPRPE